MFAVRIRTDNLAVQGAQLPLKLWVPRTVKTVAEPLAVTAEIDTAIALTYIQEGVATSLGLEPVRTVKITTPTTATAKVYMFLIRVIFPENNLMFEVNAVEVPYILRPGSTRVKCLIGRDILQYCVFTYNGRDNTFSLEFRG